MKTYKKRFWKCVECGNKNRGANHECDKCGEKR